jgi:hypothetical protein
MRKFKEVRRLRVELGLGQRQIRAPRKCLNRSSAHPPTLDDLAKRRTS